jgi:putative transposase
MCRVLRVHRSGFYAWIKNPLSDRSKEDKRFLGLIRASFLQSGSTYGSPRVYNDLMEIGEHLGEKRVARLMRKEGISPRRSYKRRKYAAGRPSSVVPNRLKQVFAATAPNEAWVTDITYIRTHEGWLYLAVVLDLHSRIVVGWSMKSRLTNDLVIDAILMAVWKRQPKNQVIVHSDQGSQYGSDEWMRFCKEHGLTTSMSRRGNCYDNAVAESFFSSLKKERVRRRIYRTRDEARADLFDYIEVFYNRIRRHSHIGQLSPYDFEMASTGRD